MQIEVSVPALLRDCTDRRGRFRLEASTLEEAIRVLFETYPLLRPHVYDDAGRMREHVLIYLNKDNVARMERLDIPLQAGDRLAVLQAVSGGCTP